MNWSRGVSLLSTANATETRKENSNIAMKCGIAIFLPGDCAIGRLSDLKERFKDNHAISRSLNRAMSSGLSSQRDVVNVEDRQHVEHAGGHQKRGPVVGADEERIAAGVSEELGHRHRQAHAHLAEISQRFEIRFGASGEELALHGQAKHEHGNDTNEQ